MSWNGGSQERTAELRHTNARLQREVEERRRAEATLDAFFSASTAILNILDDQFRYIKTDSLTPTYFGLDARSIVGRSLRDDLAPQFIEDFGPMIRRVMETGEPVHNVEVQSPVPGRPGEIVYWQASYFAVPLPEGRRGYGVVGIEITDSKRTAAALRQSHAELQAIYEGITDGIVIVDIETTTPIRANAAVCRMLGYSAEELPAVTIHQVHSPEAMPEIREFLQTVARGEVARFENMPFLHKDGRTIHVDVISRQILYDGRLCRMSILHGSDLPADD